MISVLLGINLGGIAGSHGNPNARGTHSWFPRGCTMLHPHQRSTRVLYIFVNTCYYLSPLLQTSYECTEVSVCSFNLHFPDG